MLIKNLPFEPQVNNFGCFLWRCEYKNIIINVTTGNAIWGFDTMRNRIFTSECCGKTFKTIEEAQEYVDSLENILDYSSIIVCNNHKTKTDTCSQCNLLTLYEIRQNYKKKP